MGSDEQGLSSREEAAPASGGARDVFVSYASADVGVANQLVEYLERSGVTCWIAPRNVPPGAQYAEEIIRGINEAKMLVLVLSSNSVASAHVGKEIERASSKRRPIIAIRTDTAPLPPALEYFLSESQWVEVGTGGIAEAAAKVVAAIRRQPAPMGETTASQGPSMASPQSVASKRWLVLAGVAAIAVAGIIASRIGSQKPVAPATANAPAASATVPAPVTIPEKSIAVLPFVDMSEKKDQDYFSDGLSEELINLLAQIPGMRVPARTSSFYFKGKSEDIPTIARRLLVANVLEGSVRKAGNSLRITVQLVRADNGYHLWSANYDRKVDDVFKIQDEIAAAVVKSLKVSLLGSQAPQAMPASNSEAYTLYLQARSMYQHSGTRVDDERAFDYLRRALKIDPGFARAWASLAYFLCGDAAYFDIPMDTNSRKEAYDAAARAVAIDPQLADGHAAMGRYLSMAEWNWSESETELRRALELDPSNLEAMVDLSELLSSRDGGSKEAKELALRLVERDPLYSINYQQLGLVYMRMGQLEAAEQAFRQSADLVPNAELLPSLLAWAQWHRGDSAKALMTLEHEPNEKFRYLRPLILDRLGKTNQADQEFQAYRTKYGNDAPYFVAAVYAGRKDLNHAIEWLNRAYRRREMLMNAVRSDPDFVNVRLDPRFNALLRKMNLPELRGPEQH